MKGIGVDLVNIANFRNQVEDRDAPFVKRTFTDDEIGYSFCAISGRPEQHLAVRYAAKEAAIKALDQARGDLFQRISSVDYRNIEITLDSSGRPSLNLGSELKDYACDLGIMDIKVSLSHDDDYAVAQVFMS